MKTNHSITVTRTGSGHWYVSTTHYGKQIGATITDAQAIDDYYDRTGNDRRSARGLRDLRRQVIDRN